jgi:hypothetical protein
MSSYSDVYDAIDRTDPIARPVTGGSWTKQDQAAFRHATADLSREQRVTVRMAILDTVWDELQRRRTDGGPKCVRDLFIALQEHGMTFDAVRAEIDAALEAAGFADRGAPLEPLADVPFMRFGVRQRDNATRHDFVLPESLAASFTGFDERRWSRPARSWLIVAALDYHDRLNWRDPEILHEPVRTKPE